MVHESDLNPQPGGLQSSALTTAPWECPVSSELML